MSAKDWRMPVQCADCPFSSKGAGLHLRKSLRPERWASILRELRDGSTFMCHKTTPETGDGSNKLCAGALEYQEEQGVSSQYQRVCERLDYYAQQRSTGV